MTRRLIVCFDMRAGRVVKGINFEGLRDQGDPAELATRAEASGADELFFLDVAAGGTDRRHFLTAVRQATESISAPVTIGGGIRSLDDIARALEAGAARVSINSAAVRTPALLTEAAREFGSRRIVASIDAKWIALGKAEISPGRSAPGQSAPEQPVAATVWPANQTRQKPDQYTDSTRPAQESDRPAPRVFTGGGRDAAELDAIAWARECAERGAGEILLTSIDRDGRRDGFDLELTRLVAAAVAIPVIASGGAGNADHFRELFQRTNAAAGLGAGLFHDGTTTPTAIKDVLARAGIVVQSRGE
jgi:cyclase